MKKCIERTDFTIDTGSYRMISDIRMHSVSEIHRSSTMWELENITFWREDKKSWKSDFLTHERTLLEQCIHGHLDEIFISILLLHIVSMDFIEDMCCCTVFCILIHLSSTNLYLYGLFIPLESENSSMETLISIWFWDSYIILESFGERGKISVNNPQNSITI